MTGAATSRAAGLDGLRAELFGLLHKLGDAGGLDDANGSWLDRRVDAWAAQATAAAARVAREATAELEQQRSAARIAVHAAEVGLADAQRRRDSSAADPALTAPAPPAETIPAAAEGPADETTEARS